ncbi:hypothetical protein JFL47_11395 [Haemophilus haemoglobinophilus]|nr:hypothetical protein [Canicola haemoglobinophilus]MBN6711818.1 hypothetical protein [Canicola haemoglobinophilus]
MFKKVLISLSALLAVSAANAAPDYSSLTSGIDFSSASTAVIAIAAAIAGVLVVVKGARLVLGMLR